MVEVQMFTDRNMLLPSAHEELHHENCMLDRYLQAKAHSDNDTDL